MFSGKKNFLECTSPSSFPSKQMFGHNHLLHNFRINGRHFKSSQWYCWAKRSVTPLLCQCVTSLSLQTVVLSMLILHYFLMRLINFSKQSNSFPVGEFQTRPHVMNLYTKKKELLNWGVFDWRAGGFSRSTWMKTTSPFIPRCTCFSNGGFYWSSAAQRVKFGRVQSIVSSWIEIHQRWM